MIDQKETKEESNRQPALLLKITKVWVAIFWLLTLGLTVGAGYFLLMELGYVPNPESTKAIWLALVLFVFALFFGYVSWESVRSTVTVNEEGIIYRSFGKRELKWEEIKEYKWFKGELFLFPKEKSKKKIRIHYIFKGLKHIEPMLRSRGIRNGDEVEYEEDWKSFETDDVLGETTEEKLESLSKAKHLNRGLIGLGLLINAAFIFDLVEYKVWFWVLALIPIVLLILAYTYKHYFKMNGKPKDIFPNPLATLFIASVGPAFSCFGIGWLSFIPFWLPGLSSALVLSGIWFFALRDFKKGLNKTGMKVFLSVMLFVMMSLHTFSFVGMYNYVYPGLLDMHKIEILDKRISEQDDYTDYYFTVGAWGPRTDKNEVLVDEEEYYRGEVGDSAFVGQFGGWLNIKFYAVKVIEKSEE